MPKTDKTNHYIGKNMFSLMKKECVFMNVGRGSTVDENELIKVLTNEDIRGAVLDVFE